MFPLPRFFNRLLLAGAFLGLQSVSSIAQDQKPATPQAMVEALYVPYVTPDTEAPLPPLISEEAAGESDEAYVTGELAQAIIALVKAQERDPSYSLGYDPLVDAQDYEVKALKVTAKPEAEKGGQKTAEAEAAFTNFGEKRHYLFRFVQPQGETRWLLTAVECKTGAEGRKFDLQAELGEAIKSAGDGEQE